MAARGRILAAAALGVVALAGACYEQSLALRVHEDGAGTIHVSERIAPELAEHFLEGVPEAGREARLRGVLVDELATWDGVAAWSDARAFVREGAIVFEAKGWFEDVRRLERSGAEALVHRFDLRHDDGKLSLIWTTQAESDPPPTTLPRCRAIVASLASVRIHASVTMPNVILDSSGLPGADPHTVELTLLSGAELTRELEGLEARMRRGELTEEEVVARFHPKLEQRTILASCRAGEPPSAIAAFHDELAAARTRYAGSALESEVERARRERAPRRDAASVR